MSDQPKSTRNALVTGGAHRLGAEIVRALAAKGFNVAIACNRALAEAEALAASIRDQGLDAFVVQADLTLPGAGRGIVSVLERHWTHLDVLVNSAAIYESVPFEELSPESWDAMQALNTRAPALLTRVCLPLLRESKLTGGALVLMMVDVAGERPVPGFAHYCVSKAGLHMLTRALAVELAPTLRVNGISPGTVLPPSDLDPVALEAIRKTIPQKHFGGAEDIGKLAAFLALECPHVTGQIWAVDGGRSVSGPMSVG
jgi:pteridine reductase